jgi:Family of unknown function (DUF5989)
MIAEGLNPTNYRAGRGYLLSLELADIREEKKIQMLELLKDLWGFMRERKKFWLAPLIATLLLLGMLIAIAQYSAAAPFIYTLF